MEVSIFICILILFLFVPIVRLITSYRYKFLENKFVQQFYSIVGTLYLLAAIPLTIFTNEEFKSNASFLLAIMAFGASLIFFAFSINIGKTNSKKGNSQGNQAFVSTIIKEPNSSYSNLIQRLKLDGFTHLKLFTNTEDHTCVLGGYYYGDYYMAHAKSKEEAALLLREMK